MAEQELMAMEWLEEGISGGRANRKGVVVGGEESSGFRKGLHFGRLKLLEPGRGH